MYNHIYNDKKKWNQENMKECDKWKSHISSKLHMIYISSNNGKHPVTTTFSPLHYTSPNYNSLHFTTLVDTSFPLTWTSPNYTSLPSHLASPHLDFLPPHFTSHHYASLLQAFADFARFQDSTAASMWSALFWDFMQRTKLVCYRNLMFFWPCIMNWP